MEAAARCGTAAGPRFAAPAPAWRERGSRRPPCAGRRGRVPSAGLGFAGSSAAGAAVRAEAPRRGRRGAAPPPAAVAVPGSSEKGAAEEEVRGLLPLLRRAAPPA
jgi:hypothetical protein